MNEKGIPKAPEIDNWIESVPDTNNSAYQLSVEAWRWVTRVFSNYPKVQTFNVLVTPTIVNATDESVQTFTANGVTQYDRVIVNKPTNQSGLDLVHSWVSADDTVSIKFVNRSGSPITPTSETYRVVAIRL